MLWTWIPYRKTTHVRIKYVAGRCDLPALQETIQASIDQIERVSLKPDESLAALRCWREMAERAASGEISDSQFAEWIVYQDIGLPPPLGRQA